MMIVIVIPHPETAPQRAIARCNGAPGPLAQGKDNAIGEAHASHANRVSETQAPQRVRGEMVAVHGAVIDKGDEPHERVDERVDEHEAQLAVDAGALLHHACRVCVWSLRVRGGAR